ncbi:hypothetical protein ACE6H2_014502 [Prunus campanulata]
MRGKNIISSLKKKTGKKKKKKTGKKKKEKKVLLSFALSLPLSHNPFPPPYPTRPTLSICPSKLGVKTSFRV